MTADRRLQLFIDLGLASLIAAAGIFFVMASRGLPGSGEASVPGPAAAPGFLGLALLACSAGLAVRALIAKQPALATEAAPHGALYKAGLAIGLVAACALLLEPLGFMLSSFSFLFAGFVWLGDAKWQFALPAAATASVSLWLFFTKLLGVGLPYGLLADILFR